MEVKHIHPVYQNGEERRERLTEVQRLCLRLLGDRRSKEEGGKERTG